MNDLEYVRHTVSDHMEAIQKLFKAGTRITVLVRTVGHPDRDFILTDDTLQEAITALQRNSNTERSDEV